MFGLDEIGKRALAKSVLKTFGAVGGCVTAILAANYAIDHFGTREVIATAGIVACTGMILYLVKWGYEIERSRIEREQEEFMRTIKKGNTKENMYREYISVSGRTNSFLQE